MHSHRFSSRFKVTLLSIAILVLAGCATVDPTEQIAKDRLEMARAAYEYAKTNPLVESYALRTLLEAEKTLLEAEKVNTKVYSPNPLHPSQEYDAREKKMFFNEIARLSHVAKRQSQTSVALAEGVVLNNELVKLGKERAEVQLVKSQLEKKLMEQDLAEKAKALEMAREQLLTAETEAERARILADIQAKEAALAQAQAEAKAREAEMAREELAQLMRELSELQGRLTERGIVLTIGDVLFEFDRADLNLSAQVSMDKLAAFLREKPNRKVLVEGHTDSIGTDEYNLGLSERRAAAVKNALLKRNIPTGRIVTVGYGKRFPVATNETPAGRQQNRRVDVIILNEGVDPETQFRQ